MNMLMNTVYVDDIVHDDCLDALGTRTLDTVDLVYLDPPFNTGRTMRSHQHAYTDHWSSIESYIDFLRPRLKLIYNVLKPHGSILLHCDWRTCHHLRLLLDELFGAEHFVNHLVWRYGLGGSSRRRFARKHDDILFYAKGDAYYFDPPMVPATSQRMKGQLKKATDVLDIPAINNMAAERVDYPTQKPLALLRVLIEACSPPDGVVLDPFCGSGTTLVAAHELGRQAIGIDANVHAVRLARHRVQQLSMVEAPPRGYGRR